MNEKLITHKGLADLLGVSETTVKSYRRKFPGCIPVASEGKPIRFKPEAAAVALRIRDLFNTGMSVKEVRLRLAGEFSWVEDAPEDDTPARSEKGSADLALGVSNLAKSMVAMNQQQTAMVKRMRSIESMLEELGLKDGSPVEELARERADAAKQSAERIENRLDALDALTKDLAGSMQNLAGQLDRFLGNREKAAREWRENDGASQAAALAASLAGRSENAAKESAAPEALEKAGAKVYAFRSQDAENAVRKNSPTQPESRETQPASPPAEPPRQFFSLPLVVRTAQGQYISAGGRGRGRFCLNDLKAVLVYGFAPPNHYTLSWETHGQGWWLRLEQPQKDGSRTLRLLLMELPTQKGGNVLEILQLQDNGRTVHPAEFPVIIDAITA